MQISKLNKQTIVSEFDSHRMPQISGLVSSSK